MILSSITVPWRRMLAIALAAALVAALAVAMSAFVPARAAASAGTLDNPNPIDWTQHSWYVNHQGMGFPLRMGQHDNGPEAGFGVHHIEDKHAILPPQWDIEATVSDPGGCQYNYWDQRWRCHSSETLLYVVYSTQHDDRSGDKEPFGIITAYYMLPPGCGPDVAGDVGVQCEAEPIPTSVSYRGPDHATNGAPLEVSARLGDDLGIPKPGQPLTFTLGTGAAEQTCEGTTAESGVATCVIDEVDQPVGPDVPLRIDYAGNEILQPSSTTVRLGLKTPTKTEYDGPEYIANGESTALSAVLTDHHDGPVADRTLTMTLGGGGDAQNCSGTTDADGRAECAIDPVDQPLNEAATVPVSAVFAGDDGYLGSEDEETVQLEYYTGRAYGLSAGIDLVLIPITLPPRPDTGEVRTAEAESTDVPCTATVTAVVLTVEALCADVTTTLAPGTVTASSSVEHATIGLPGLPVIDVAGLTTTATSTCGAATGSTSLTLTVGGTPVPVPDTPNAVVDLAGGVRLTLNEQTPTEGGVTVTGVHLTVLGGDTEIVLGSATGAVHNCAP